MIDRLREMNRTLLDMQIGIVTFGIVAQGIGAIVVHACSYSQGMYAKSLWFGILMALVAATHMLRTLERALGPGVDASKVVVAGYTFRYAFLAIVLAVTGYTGALNPLVIFLGYMSLKVTAYAAPLTHRFTNWLFHETDEVLEETEEVN